MLETSGRLRTWSLADEPQVGRCSVGQSLEDHRIEYLQYEGPLTGNRGHVSRWDRGEYTLLDQDEDRLIVRLAGERLQCTAKLTRQSGDATAWIIAFEPSCQR
jgi:hypothetical protein